MATAQVPARPTATTTASASSAKQTSQPAAPAAAEKPKAAQSAVERNNPALLDAFADLDAMDRGETPQPAQTAPAKSTEPTKPAQETPAKPAEAKVTPEKPSEKASAKAETETKPTEGEAPADQGKFEGFATAHDLRKAWRKRGEQIDSLTSELNELRERTKQDPKQLNALAEENKALKSRLTEMDQELRYVEFTKSDEFKTKFEKPFQDALTDAYEEIKEYVVTDDEGNSRMATPKDFNELLDSPPEVIPNLVKKFGDYSGDVKALRRKLIDLRRSADREAKRYREEGSKREADRVAKQVEERETMEKLWRKANEIVVEKYPQYFGKVEGDDEINQALERGYQIVDKAHDPNLSTEEKVERLAVLRHKAAAFSAVQLRLKRANDRVKELEEIVKSYEASEPGEGKQPTAGEKHSSEPGMPEGYESADNLLEKLAEQDAG